MPKKVLPDNHYYETQIPRQADKNIKKYAQFSYRREDMMKYTSSKTHFYLATDYKTSNILEKETNNLITEGKYVKKFFSIERDSENHLNKLLSEDNNMYEIIPPDIQVKLYFDLEAPLKDDESDTLFTTFFMTAIAHILNNDFEISFNEDDIYILNSSRQNKFSNHIIFKSIRFNNLEDEKMFITYVINRFNNPLNDNETIMFNKLFFINDEKNKCIVDFQPYGHCQNYRCINQSKINKPYQLKSIKPIKYLLDTFVTYKTETCRNLIKKETIEEKHEQMKKPIKQIKKRKEQTAPETKTETTNNINNTHFNNFDYTLKNGNTLLSSKNMSYMDLKNLPLYKRYLYLIPNNYCGYDNFLNIGFAIKGSGGNKEDWKQWAMLSTRYGNSGNAGSKIDSFDTFKTDGRIFNINTLKRIAKKSHPDFFNTEEELFRVYFDLELDGIEIIEEKSEFVSQEGTPDANNILDDNKFIILYAYLGRGKTTAIKRMILEQKYERYLFLSPRVSFSLFISQEFEIDNYTDALLDNDDKDKVYINKSKKLIISVESIQKINVDNNYQCIFLDESEAILNQFSSPTMKSKYLDCYNILNSLILNAEKVVCADAFLTNRTIRFIKSYNQPITLIKNNTSPIKRDAIRLSYEDLEKQLINEITNNKKPYICSSTKKQLELIDAGRKFIPDKFNKSLMYFGGYKRDDKMFKETLKNINTTWKDASFVGTTPTNTIGCSYSQKNDFDNVYMMCPAPTCSVRDMMQMMMRVRHIKENKMYFSLPENKRNMKKNRDDIYYLSLDNFENYNKDKLQICIDEVDKFMKEDKDDNHNALITLLETLKKFEETPKPLREIIYFNLFEMYISNTYYEKMYYKFLDRCGYKYEPVVEEQFIKEKKTKKEDIKCKKELENIEDEKLNQMIKDYNDIDDVDDITEYLLNEKLMKSNCKDKLIKEKYFYKRMIKKDLPVDIQAKNFYNGYLNTFTKNCFQRAYDEKHRSYIMMIENEINDSNKCKEMIKGHFLKLSIIKKIVETLKIENSFDTNTIIPRENINQLISYMETNRKRISNIFDFDDSAKDNVDAKYKFKSFMPYIERCITNWSGCYFKGECKDSHTKQFKSYRLSGKNFYELIKDKKIENTESLFNDLDYNIEL